jgi:glutaredoxin-like protein NrdH
MGKSIVLYSLSSCPKCGDVKSLLQSRKSSFKFHNVDWLAGEERNNVMRALKKANPEVTFPTLVVGDEVVVGAKMDRIREVLDAHEKG